jgi:hypothetical protein
VKDSICWAIDRVPFRRTLKRVNAKKIDEYCKVLEKVYRIRHLYTNSTATFTFLHSIASLFLTFLFHILILVVLSARIPPSGPPVQVPDMGALSSFERARIAEALDETVYLPGTVICKQGDPGDTFFIIKAVRGPTRSIITNRRVTLSVQLCTCSLVYAISLSQGSVKAVKLGSDKTVEAEMTLNAGDYFGELALRRSEPRAATVTAVGAVVCLCMDRFSFNVCFLHNSYADSSAAEVFFFFFIPLPCFECYRH